MGKGVLALVSVNGCSFSGLRSIVWRFRQALGADRGAAVGSRSAFPVILGLRPAVRFPLTRCLSVDICVRGCRDSREGMVSCCRGEYMGFASSGLGVVEPGGRFGCARSLIVPGEPPYMSRRTTGPRC